MKEQFISCPVCETKIPFYIQQLLEGALSCPNCDVFIRIAPESKKVVQESVETLKRLKERAKKN